MSLVPCSPFNAYIEMEVRKGLALASQGHAIGATVAEALPGARQVRLGQALEAA